ncbi:MAG: HIT domain-containing protein [Nitrospirota bacterium]|nr:HIT domain-containing protein [Nitrospirota bacterium]
MEGLGRREVSRILNAISQYPGLTVVIPKKNIGDYVFGLEQQEYQDLMLAARTVAKFLEKAFNTSRVALVFEGTGVAHVHAKLIPLHGKLADQTNVWSPHREFNPEYLGYLTTAEGPKMGDAELTRIQKMIVDAQGPE